MNNCLNCGKEIVQKNGGKERKFCDNNNACKQAYHNAHKKPQKYVLKETYDKLLAQIAENNKPENKAEIEAKRNGTAGNTKKEYKYPLSEKDVVRSGGFIPNENGGMTFVETIPKKDTLEIEQRIKEIQDQLKSPPKNPIIGLRTWIRVRQEEIQKLEKELK